MTAMTPAPGMELSVDDIMSDLMRLDTLQARSISNMHPLLALGNSLMPASLESCQEGKGSQYNHLATTTHHTSSSSDSNKKLDELQDVLSQLEEGKSIRSQSAALHLSSIYLDRTKDAQVLNQLGDQIKDGFSSEPRDREDNTSFDAMHRRVARLQSTNEGYIARLEEMRDTVTTASNKGSSSDIAR